jgi:hypothetical protein
MSDIKQLLEAEERMEKMEKVAILHERKKEKEK